MQCPGCGAHISVEDAFCGECGRPLPEAPPSAPSQVPPDIQDQPADNLVLVPPAGTQAPPPLPKAKKPPIAAILAALVVGLALLCVLLAVAFALIASRTPTSPDPASLGGSVLYQDDFSDPDSGWDIYDEDDSEAGYSYGEYRVGVYDPDWVAWGNANLQQGLANVVVEVDVRQVEGPLDNNFGILLRYQPDGESFYWFQISGDGYYSVDLTEGEDWTALVDWETSDDIRQGIGATNRLKVVGTGDQFSLYVNDEFLTSFSDSRLVSGDIGLAAGTFDETGVIVHFDNLVVRGIGGE